MRQMIWPIAEDVSAAVGRDGNDDRNGQQQRAEIAEAEKHHAGRDQHQQPKNIPVIDSRELREQCGTD